MSRFILLAVALASACADQTEIAAPTVVASPPAKAPAVSVPLGPEAESLRRLDETIQGHERVAATRSDRWGELELVALGYMDRARLTGSYDDYAKAQDAIARAFAAGNGFGPYLTRATFNYSVHRLGQVERDLARVEGAVLGISPQERAAIDSLRADVAFHTGRYAEARAAYERIAGQERSPAALVALSQYFWKTGDFERASALLAEAVAAAPEGAHFPAWLNLVQGLMALDRGRWDEALTSYREGLRHRPGYWLLQEHEAEILALQGQTQSAVARYLNLIERTQNPEFMDAVAGCYDQLSNRAEAERWVRRAREGFDQRVRLFPEASAGHAIDFYLQHDPPRALELAQINVRARPGGEAQVKLAQAQLRNNQIVEARATIERVLATVWNTGELHATASLVYELSGNATRAQTERERALALNPHAMDDSAELRPNGT